MSSPINIELKHSTKIIYKMINSGDPGSTITTNKKLLLSIGRIYQIPINTTDKLDDYHVFKTYGELNETIDVRNIRDGFAFILPIVNNIMIYDGQVLGSFI